jgi:hypothetical protein
LGELLVVDIADEQSMVNQQDSQWTSQNATKTNFTQWNLEFCFFNNKNCQHITNIKRIYQEITSRIHINRWISV